MGGITNLKKAGDAKTQTEQAKADENLKIAIAESYGTDGKLNLKDLKDNLKIKELHTLVVKNFH
jgi:hypothetical protein